MKHIYIAGNWKSNKTTEEADLWIKSFVPRLSSLGDSHNNATVIVFSPFSALYVLKKNIVDLKQYLQLGAQNISAFKDGAYTGEESARMIKELADWVLIGHSERRKYQHEDDKELFEKTLRAKEAGLKVLYCVPNENTIVPNDVDIVGYEPVWAIGSGQAESPEKANHSIDVIKQKTSIPLVVYGGSVTSDNVRSYIDQPKIDGILPGGASLDPEKYFNLIQKALGV